MIPLATDPSIDGSLNQQDGTTAASSVVFLGTGSSVGVPNPMCLITPKDPPCAVCTSAVAGPPEECPNYRCNPSLLIRYAHPDRRTRHIQIDCGKHFRETLLRWFPRYNVTGLDAVLLSHDHADAVFGMDDLRSVQGYHTAKALPVWLTQTTMEALRARFNYLMPSFMDSQVVQRSVSQLDWRIIQEQQTFTVQGLECTALPVQHGADYTSLGFLFGTAERCAYISDCSHIGLEVMQRLRGAGLRLLVLDALFVDQEHPTHMNLHQALDVVRVVRPQQALLTGLTHEFDHHKMNERLAQLREVEGLHVQLARDGLCIPLEL